MSAKTVQAAKCFVCGSENSRALDEPFIFDGDRVTARFTPDDAYSGFDCVVHAGILFALADGAMMHLIYGNHIKAIPSEVTLRLKKFARTNSPLLGIGDSLQTGRHLVICRDDGKFLYYTDNHPFKKSGL